MKNVWHISRRLMINSLKEKQEQNTAFISINDSSYEAEEMIKWFGDANCLILRFPDVDDSAGISQDQADEIVKFIHRNRSVETFIVHCFLGVSRSAAVAKWINDHYGLDLPHLEAYDIHNKRVYQMLEAACGNDLAAYYQALEEADRKVDID